MPFTTADEIREFKRIIRKILLDAHPEVLTLHDVLSRFKAYTKTDFKKWFKENHRDIPKSIPLFETHLNDLVILDMKSRAPDILVRGKGDAFKTGNFGDKVQRLSKDDCANNLRQSIQTVQGVSKDTAIEVNEEEEEEEDFFEFDYVEVNVPFTDEFKELHYDASKFINYRDFQMVHIAYTKLRMIFMYNHIGRNSLHIHTVMALFRQLFNESFFQNSIMKHYITSTDDRNKNVITFLQRFCGDFLFVNDEGKTKICHSLDTVTTKLMQNLVKSIAKIAGLGGPGIPVTPPPNPPHIHFTGDPGNTQPTDVRRCPEYTSYSAGPSKPMVSNFLDFPGINKGPVNKGPMNRPSIHDVNDAINTIRARLCREHSAVKVPEIIKELCQMYGVASLRDLRPSQHREIKRESDIPALNDIIKLQGKVNAFSQAFGTFRNVTTLHELEEELCRMESKQCFDDLRLGPLQKQLIVWDIFQFPPDKDVIPPITTFDVFRLLWKCYDEKYTQERRNAKSEGVFTTAREMHVKILLPDFLEYVRRNYGFSLSEESGVRINNVGHALQACRKAWFSDSHNVKKSMHKFKEQLTAEFIQQLEHTKNMLLAPLMNPEESDDENLREKFKEIPLMESLKMVYDILQQLKREACKTLPTTAYLVNFSDITMNALSVIQKDELMSKIFHFVFTIAPFKVVGKTDIQILKYLGFQKAVDEMMSGVPDDTKTAVNIEAAKNMDPNAVAVSAANAGSDKASKVFPKSTVTSTVNKWFSKATTLDLKVLATIESQITAEIHEAVTSFDRLGHGSFLKFITENKSLYRLLEFGTATSADVLGAKVTKEELIHFVIQCGNGKKKSDISRAIEMQYKMPVQGKNADQILKVADENRKRRECLISYQHTYLVGTDYHRDCKDNGNRKSFTQLALKRIKAAPFLVDLGEWINWKIMFSAKLGSFKEFLNMNFTIRESYFTFMELDIGRYVKVLKFCSLDDFRKALDTLDASKTSACLVNILMSSLNMNNSPIAMLSNLIQNSFMQYIGREYHPNSNAGKDLIFFVLECFRLIPFEMLCCIAQKLFINRLAAAFGIQKVSAMVLEVASETTNQAYRQILHGLGYQLSINEWIKDAEQFIAVYLEPTMKKETEPKEKKKEQSEAISKEKEGEEIASKEKTVSTSNYEEISDDDEEPAIEFKDIEMKDEKPATKEGEETSENVKEEATTATKVEAETSSVKEGEENIKDEGPDDEKPKSEETPEDAKVKVEEVKPLTCEEFVEKIRREEFGVGMTFGEEEKKILDIHRAREGRSLDRLSRELYTKDSHFVLELIQNADDNEYSEQLFDFGSAEKPTVCFIVEPQSVTVLNNEKGFTHANVKALCDIGKSTKGIHRKGYIGQKGIGFKSVFRVTDKPEVHSNGFHIQYDASYGPNGYILPQWVDEGQEEIEYALPNGENEEKVNWATKIVLPLKSEMQHAKLTSRFHDIHPSLLMFLNRLHSIIIDDKVSGTVKVMKKEIIDKNLVKLTENDESTFWFVVTKEIPIELKEEVKQTDISIAFPLPDPNQEQQTLPAQPIFAYLPLRSYGFKFIIQADFEVPSSREDIDMDSAWNQCILHYIPELVSEAFTQFKAHPHFTGYQGIIQYFKFMDLEDHVLGIFKQVAHNVIKGLQRKPCIPYVFTLPEEAGDSGKADSSEKMETSGDKEQIMWTVPTSCVVGTDDLRKTVPPKMLLKNLGLNFVAKELQNNVKESILDSLGVSKMSVEQLVDIAKAFLNEIHERVESGEKLTVGERQKNFDWIGEWLSVIFTTMQENCDFSQETIALIKSLKIFVLCDGSFVSMTDQTIFFPIDLDVTGNNKNNKSDPLRVIEKDLQILTYDIYLNLDLIQKQQVRRLLKDLGVKSMTPSDLIYNHIIPLFKEEKWKTKSEDLLIACVSYLRQQMTFGLISGLFQISELKEHIILATNKGLKSPSKESIYISSEYGNEHLLKERFPACDWTLVSPKYLSESASTLQKKSWLEFFQTIGLDVFVRLQPKTVEMHSSDLAHSVWKEVFSSWPATENGTYVIEDLAIPEFEKLMKAQQRSEIVGFAYLINNYWEERFLKQELQKASCLVKDTSGTVLTTTNSSFYMKIQESKWIPSTTEQLYVPSNLYIVNPSVEKLFANKVAYVHPKISNDDFRDTLGVQRDVKMANFITQFKRWNESTEAFSTTYGHIQNIYRFVRDVLSEEAKEIMINKCIFLPSLDEKVNKAFIDDDKVEGNFYKMKEVCWDDPTGIVEISKDVFGTRRTLKGFFPDQMKDFFVQTLGVPMFPTTTEYLNAAYNLVNRTILPDKDALRKLFKMFYVLGQKCCIAEKVEELKEWGMPDSTKERIELYHSLEDFVDPEMRQTLQSERNNKTRLIPTSSNIFLAIDNRPILSIDPEVHKMYAKDRQVDVAVLSDVARMNRDHKEHKLPSHLRRSKELEIETITLYVMLFYKSCGLELLYDLQCKPEIVALVVTEGCYFWELVLHNIVPAVQRFMMVYLPDIYDDLQKKDFAQFLFDTEINMCAKLEVLYHLKNRVVDIRQDRISVVQFVENENKALVYINKTFGEGFQQGEVVLRELMTIFAGSDKKAIEMMSDFILTYTTVLNKETYMRRKRLLPIAEGEKIWEFKKPADPFPTDVEDVPSKAGDKSKGGDKTGRKKKIDRGDVLMKQKQGNKDKDTEDPFEEVGLDLYDQEQIEEFGTGTDKRAKRSRKESGVDDKESEEESGRTKRRRTLPRKAKGGDSSSQEEADEEADKEAGEENSKKKDAKQKPVETEEVVMGVDVPPPPPPDIPSENAPPPPPEGEEAVDLEVKEHEAAENERPSDPRLRKKKSDGTQDSDGEIEEDGEVNEANSWFNDFNAAMRYNALKPSKKFLRTVVDLKEQYEDVPMKSKGAESVNKEFDLDRLMVDKDPGNQVGMMGEEIVYKHLCHQYADELKSETVHIEWLNEDEEFGLPYDMKLTFFDERQPPVMYIEVKTTFRDEKKEFEISSNQIKFAFEQGERFNLYRLTGIRSPKEMKLRRLANLATYLDNKSVKLFMVL